jgi:prepilin-type N-terminal cleavage/methylation domain-containing protein
MEAGSGDPALHPVGAERFVTGPLRPHARWVRRGFTLIELLAAIAIIVVLVAAAGIAFSDPGGSALATAQNTVATLVQTARAQAAVNQTRARFCVYGLRPPSGDTERFLRLLQVFREDPPTSNTWVAVGNPVYLPRGVYVVPNPTSGLVVSGVTWPANPAPVSTLSSGFNPGQPVGTPFNAATAYYLEYSADGTLVTTLSNQVNSKVVVATATINNNLPQFNNPGAVRGLLLRPTGGVTFVNDPTGF